jgi:xanthine dehydrogenase accessory factor
MLAALADAKRERRAVAFAKRLTDAAELLLPDSAASAELNAAALQAMAAGSNGTHVVNEEPWFIEARNPPPRLAVVGGVHVAQALVPLARMAGFDVIVIDPRQAFANPERFPEAQICNTWPDSALLEMALDGACAVVALTHDPKLDDSALSQALNSPAFYIGALGSRKTHAARIERLRTMGHDDAALARIRGPVGLDIGAIGPAEIALSIMAEIVAARRGAKLGKRSV